MDDVEFRPIENENLKRIGDGHDNTRSSHRENPKKNSSKPPYSTMLIVGILAIVAFLAYLYFQSSSTQQKQTEAELLDIKSALYLYKESFGNYPNQLTELTKGRPLREVWLTDAWEQPYRYEVGDDNQTFIVISAGEDGEFGSEDDIRVQD